MRRVLLAVFIVSLSIVSLSWMPTSGQAQQSDRNRRGPAAGGDAEAIEKSLRNYRIRLSDDRKLSGMVNLIDPNTNSIAPVIDMTVAFLKNGEQKAKVGPDKDGVFLVEGLEPGIYAVVGWCRSGYIATSVQLLEPSGDGKRAWLPPRDGGRADSPFRLARFQEVEHRLQIDSLAVPPRDFRTVTQLVKMYIPPAILNAKPTEMPDIAGPDKELTNEAAPTDAAPSSTILQRHSVKIAADGSLTGRTRRVHPQTGARPGCGG